VTGERIGQPLEVALDGPPLPVPRFRRTVASPFAPEDSLRRLGRHDSCRFVLLWDESLDPKLKVRIFDRSRRFVPRRIQITVPTLAQITGAEKTLNPIGAIPRVRRPYLFPGAAYDLPASATGLRARVERGGKRMPWARIEATAKGRTQVIGRAHGDDRGEFLLVLGRNEGVFSALPASLKLDVTITVTGPQAPPPAPPAGEPPDPLRDLPLEVVTNLAVRDDDVSTGKTNPYDPTAVSVPVDLSLPYGRITSIATPIAL
jgi:hypothetical protein